MKSEISKIYQQERTGAYGVPPSFGTWVWGNIGKAKTQCRVRRERNLVTVKSSHRGQQYLTESIFVEWQLIASCKTSYEQMSTCEKILRLRRLAQFPAVISEKNEQVGTL